MAANLRSLCFASAFTVLHLFITACVYAGDGGSRLDLSSVNPQEEPVDIMRIGEEFMTAKDLIKSVYHLHKREANSSLPLPSPAPPIKKAIQNEKKASTKSPPVGDDDSKTVEQAKADILNTSVSMNLTEVNATTVNKKQLKDKYFSTTPSSTASAAAVTTVLPEASTAEVPTTTEFGEILPERPSNITNTTVDYHVYYNSSFYLEEKEAMAFWVNFDEIPKDKVVMHHMLSDSHRRAATVTLSFDFPFYGHPLRNITIATGGFLYMGDYMHSWLAATQYVAPLMANFDTSLSNESTVRYFDNGTAFVIEWNEVALQDGRHRGPFTFQAILLKKGDIVFVYNTIPVSVTKIGDVFHPVKVGLSDAYVIDRVIYFIRRKTIYEYHRIDMKRDEIGNHTAIYFTALTTCLNFGDCDSCINAEIGLHCIWCESANRCSDGLDRQRQDWLQQRCDVEKSSVNCSALSAGSVNPFVQPYTDTPFRPYTVRPPPGSHDIHPHLPDSHIQPFNPHSHEDGDEVVAHRVQGEEGGSMGVGGVVAILLILGIVLGGAAWISYAYRNPHTSSGQLLIRYRPSQWRFRSGEARYTAASVHM